MRGRSVHFSDFTTWRLVVVGGSGIDKKSIQSQEEIRKEELMREIV